MTEDVLRDDRLAHQEHGLHVHRHDIVPGGLREARQVAGRHNAGVVEHNVDLAERRKRQRHHTGDRGGVGDVAGEGDRTRALGFEPAAHRFKAGAIAIHQHQARAMFGEDLGRPRADARRRAGDDRRLARQSCHRVPSFYRSHSRRRARVEERQARFEITPEIHRSLQII
jgi:hypothetical protein